MSSYPNIQLSFSSEVQKLTKDNLFLLQDWEKLIISSDLCKLQQWTSEISQWENQDSCPQNKALTAWSEWGIGSLIKQ